MNKRQEIELKYDSPIYVMAKPAGAACNLQCRYCYYLEKAGLNGAHSKMMSDETLELFIKDNCHKNYLLRLLFFFMNGITINRIAEKIKIRINDVIAS